MITNCLTLKRRLENGHVFICGGEMGDMFLFFFFSSRRRHTRFDCDWSSDVCSSDLNTTTTDGLFSFQRATPFATQLAVTGVNLQSAGLVTGATGSSSLIVFTSDHTPDRKSVV